MTPIKRQRSTKEVGSSSQAPRQPQRTSRASTIACAKGSIPYPVGLTHPNHVARYNCLNERIVIATRYYDDDLLARLGMLDDIRWLFAKGGMGQFLEIEEYTYGDLTLESLSTLHVKVTRGSQCQAGYISFYLQDQLYELNLDTFNSIFGFPPSTDLPNRQVPREFNPNAFWGCLLYTSPSPRDGLLSRMPSSA